MWRTFNPRAREGRDQGQVIAYAGSTGFQSTRPRGARPQRMKSLWHCLTFNPRAREGRDAVGMSDARQYGLSIHAPARGATGFVPQYAGVPRLSIHAPARGATTRCSLRTIELPLSIHAPARGATPRPYARGQTSRAFNPRAREGRDESEPLTVSLVLLSIHAPARGATFGVIQYLVDVKLSIHAPARGATEPHRRRRGARKTFNPRAREGRDPLSKRVRAGASAFQSTRPRGARLTSSASSSSARNFQSTRPRGARPG